jgi:nickel-dependent lactate racemase
MLDTLKTVVQLQTGVWYQDSCSIEVHNDLKGTKRIGVTSYRTPVYVNRTVLNADLLIGVGGIYPQHTTGFGGGGKLALGVCGRQTIMHLHFKHKSNEGQYATDNDFRKDVCEIAKMIGLNSIVNLHIDAFSRVVNVVFGNHSVYYDDAARFSKRFYTVPSAGDTNSGSGWGHGKNRLGRTSAGHSGKALCGPGNRHGSRVSVRANSMY